jgi:two-component system, NarL family, nitrate/nitrite response regulator NarL
MPAHQSPAGYLRPGPNLAGSGRGPANLCAVLIATSREPLMQQLKGRLSGAYTTYDVSEWEALDRTISTLSPAVVLLDVALLKSSGINDLSIIRRISRKTRVLVLSASPNDEEALAGLKAGARGYCDRDLDANLLRRAVDRVREGEVWAERRLIPILVEQFARDCEERPEPRARSDRRLALLTPREQEIAWSIGAGGSNRDIAVRLKVGEGTVKAHLTSIFRKLGFADRLQLGLFLASPVGRRRH